MSESKLIELGYYDPSAKIRLSAYADTVVLDPDKKGSVICAIRFGGYPEMVRAMADAIYGGATIEATQNDMVRKLQSKLKGYQRQITHDGVYAVATLMAADDAQEETLPQDECGLEDDRQKGDEEAALQNRHSHANATFSVPKGIGRACLRNWTTKQQHLSSPCFRTMYSPRSKTVEISDSWRSSRKKSGSTHGC